MNSHRQTMRAFWLGRVPYREASELQERLVEARKNDLLPDTLLLLEHPHVVTLGKRSAHEHLLAASDKLDSLGIEVHETDRGGEVTYHGPGQLIAYPIVSIRAARIGPVTYVRLLEQTVIDVLRHFKVSGHRVVGKTGVWAGGEPGNRLGNGQNPSGAKIAAIGLRVSGGVTKHGFSLNVSTDLNRYAHIVPCGMPDLAVASIQTLSGKDPGLEAVGCKAAGILAGFLDRRLEWAESEHPPACNQMAVSMSAGCELPRPKVSPHSGADRSKPG